MKKLSAITVCVRYADLLAHSLQRWKDGLDQLIVVTSPTDKQTQAMCATHKVKTHVTDVFYANGAAFNKGAAIAEAELCAGFRTDPESDWILLFDSDVLPPVGWRKDLDAYGLEPGYLYGSWRYQLPENGSSLEINPQRRMRQNWVIGFFTLFHASDPMLPVMGLPLVDIDWPHAGMYDTMFTRRWPRDHQAILPMPMGHFGAERRHWFGRGNLRAAHAAMMDVPIGEMWEKQRLKVKPLLRGMSAPPDPEVPAVPAK